MITNQKELKLERIRVRHDLNTLIREGNISSVATNLRARLAELDVALGVIILPSPILPSQPDQQDKTYVSERAARREVTFRS